MKLKRNYVTPFISLIFLVVSISGLLMFFHLFDGYIEVVHEVLGLVFVVCAIFHIVLNWKALRIHFKKGVFLPALLATLTLSAIFIVIERLYPPIDLQIMERIIKAPVHDAFRALDVNYKEASGKLKNKGIFIEKAHRLEDIWMQNDSDPQEIIDLILE